MDRTYRSVRQADLQAGAAPPEVSFIWCLIQEGRLQLIERNAKVTGEGTRRYLFVQALSFILYERIEPGQCPGESCRAT